MNEIAVQGSIMTAVIQVIRKDTGLVEDYILTGTIVPDEEVIETETLED